METEPFLKHDLLYIKTKYVYHIPLSPLKTIKKNSVLKENFHFHLSKNIVQYYDNNFNQRYAL